MKIFSVQRQLKRALDIGGATIGLAIAAPVLVTTAAVIRTTMGSPVLFRQMRPGLNGEPFELLKFRSMAVARDNVSVGEDELRLTNVGRVIRKLSIDELPSLINVLKGELSLVGPRPLLVRYLDRYTPEQARRHEVPPGVTGWAQVNGRNAIGWEEKFLLDVWYVDNWSLALDLKVLVMTLGKGIMRSNISAAGLATMSEFMGTQNSSNDLRNLETEV